LSCIWPRIWHRSYGTRFRLRLERGSITQASKWRVYVTEMIIYDWPMIIAYVLMCFLVVI